MVIRPETILPTREERQPGTERRTLNYKALEVVTGLSFVITISVTLNEPCFLIVMNLVLISIKLRTLKQIRKDSNMAYVPPCCCCLPLQTLLINHNLLSIDPGYSFINLITAYTVTHQSLTIARQTVLFLFLCRVGRREEIAVGQLLFLKAFPALAGSHQRGHDDIANLPLR